MRYVRCLSIRPMFVGPRETERARGTPAPGGAPRLSQRRALSGLGAVVFESIVIFIHGSRNTQEQYLNSKR